MEAENDTMFVIQGMTAAKLEQRFKELRSMIEELRPKKRTEADQSMRSRQEVADLLKISLVTLDCWRKHGIIKSVKIGGKVFFSEQEIERVCSNNPKYKRA